MSPIVLTQSKQHLENSALAIQGKKPGPGKYHIKLVDLQLEETTDGWMLIIGRGNPMPATDAEVTLWLALQEASRN